MRFVVYFLMLSPMWNIEVNRTVHDIAADHPGFFQFGQPSLHEHSRVVVVGVQKAREHSRGRASPPVIVNDGPELNEKQTRITRQSANAFALRELWFYGSDARH